jgi:hypothetical protein
MSEFTINAEISRDGVLVGSAYGSGETLGFAVHDIQSDLSNFELECPNCDGVGWARADQGGIEDCRACRPIKDGKQP